jgi:hypothetical protein
MPLPCRIDFHSDVLSISRWAEKKQRDANIHPNVFETTIASKSQVIELLMKIKFIRDISFNAKLYLHSQK